MPTAQDCLKAISGGLPHSKQRRTASKQTAEDCLVANGGGLPHSKQRRIASMPTAQDCLKAISGGLPHSKQRRTASQQTTEDCHNANSAGLSQVNRWRTTSQQTAEDCLKGDSTLLRYSETLSFLLGFVLRLLVMKTFRKASVFPSAGSRYEPLCCTPYKYRLSVPETGCRNIVLISPIRRQRTKCYRGECSRVQYTIIEASLN